MITYDPSNKELNGTPPYFGNEYSTALKCVSLVVELIAHSILSLVHIPLIIPSETLLQERDEVFKEIKDAGEDVARSSPHLLQGDMNIHPLSFHEFLEEEWNWEERPEEIKAMLEVVTPAYCHHLDVFSNVKEEKLPQHRPCDHHIALEGSLPSVGVI
ncbi:hypothetical protein O181_025054 [Austropuccinia psidii MF-1]|uniref:Endonuclease/exonuclease/phosphatase domain-containing protein n=1 Tax=Austropuccinia psidii MF-1 TaxID=1389203 RepID=A0A9Q3CHB4_9BASI|nr:hypothetical protein [Austropuccinia psidii MF-1]